MKNTKITITCDACGKKCITLEEPRDAMDKLVGLIGHTPYFKLTKYIDEQELKSYYICKDCYLEVVKALEALPDE